MNTLPTIAWMTIAAAGWFAVFQGAPAALGDDAPAPAPRILSTTPLEVSPGTTANLSIRGLGVTNATAVQILGAPAEVRVEIKDRKPVEVPAGLEARDVGDTQLLASFSVPPALQTPVLEFRILTPKGDTPPTRLRVVNPGALLDEAEPNDGFRTARAFPLERTIRGAIGSNKDVDVFSIVGRARQELAANVRASSGGSLLDPILTLYDEQGRTLASVDDTASSKDPEIRFKVPSDGRYFLAIQDANDRGGPWNSYELVVTDETPVSFFHDVRPILRRACIGCHQPSKLKGGLDLTTYPGVMKTGRHAPVVRPRDPEFSRIIRDISGEEPAMPDEGDPLEEGEVAILSRWIRQGARDDTPPADAPARHEVLPVYHSLPAVTALAWSPSGDLLAVTGSREVTLHSRDGTQRLGRLFAGLPRIEAIAFSPDGGRIAISGGAASGYGEIQLWDVATRTLVRSIRATTDSLFGVSWSPDGARVAAGGTDKTVRVFSTIDGSEVMKCDNHLDWVFATAWSLDGKRLVSASRDRALKLIDVTSGRLIDDVNRPRDPLLALVRHPTEDRVACGSDSGGIRVYRIEPRGGRLAEGDDRESGFERELNPLSGPVQAIAWSAGKIAAGGTTGEVRIYQAADGARKTTLHGTNGPVYALAFCPDEKFLAAAGYDGRVRIFDPDTGRLRLDFAPVPLSPPAAGK